MKRIRCDEATIAKTNEVARSVKDSDGSQLTVEKLLAHMEYMVISSVGTSARELLSVLPTYEREQVTNVTDFSLCQDSPHLEATTISTAEEAASASPGRWKRSPN